jgi:hypothetical protein
MKRANSKINKTGVLEEPANPKSAKNFFKSANDWTRLSGYVGNFPLSSSPTPSIPEKSSASSDFPIFPKKTIELSHKSHEDKVKTALNYLFLRDLGCSRDEAISFTSRKRTAHGDFVTSLPPTLRSDFRLRLVKSRCLPCRPLETFENFESATEAFRDLIFKKQLYFDNACLEQERYLKKIEKDSKRLKIFTAQPSPTPDSFQDTSNSPKTNNMAKRIDRKSTRVVVPEVKPEEQEKKLRNLSFLKESLIGMKETEQEISEKIEKNTENQKIRLKIKEIKSLESFSFSETAKVDLTQNKSDPRATEFETCLSTLSSKRDEKKSLNSENTSKISFPSENKNLSTPRSEKWKNFNFSNLIDEEKKLIDLIRLQKFKTARLKSEQHKKSQEATKSRKKIINLKESEAKLQNFHKKKEKIRKAQEKKLLMIRARSK